MPATRRSTRKSAGRTPSKYDPEEEENKPQWDTGEAVPIVAQEFPESDEEDEDEEFDDEDDDENMPNIHFGTATRAALEAAEAEEGGATMLNPRLNIFLLNAIIEGGAALTAIAESFLPADQRMLISDDSSPMTLRMWGGAIVGLAATSFFMSMEDPSGSRSAFCLGMTIYHACAVAIILHVFFTAEETPLPGAALAASTLGSALDAVMQRKLCAMAAVSVHGYLGFGLYTKAQEPTDEVLVVWEDDEDDEDEDDA